MLKSWAGTKRNRDETYFDTKILTCHLKGRYSDLTVLNIYIHLYNFVFPSQLLSLHVPFSSCIEPEKQIYFKKIPPMHRRKSEFFFLPAKTDFFFFFQKAYALMKLFLALVAG